MSNNFAKELRELFEPFERECKRVEVYKSRELTKRTDKIKEYKECLVRTYNDLLTFLSDAADKSLNDRTPIENRIITYLKRLKECFQLLKLNYQFDSNIHSLIDIDRIVEEGTSNPNSDSDASASSNKTIVDNSKDKSNNTDDNKQEQSPEHSPQTTPPRSRTNSSSSENSLEEMAQSAKSLMQLATSTINYKYDGDPMKLDSFIDAIDLLEELCEEQNKGILLKFLMTKLEGKAREAMIKQPEKVDDIVQQLRDAIKAESSKVIEGRMLALRTDKTNLTKFTDRAEELAEQYRRSLISEKIPKEMAINFAIEKTKELCRRNARSPTVISIIEATTFKEPKDVVSRFIVEINKQRQYRSEIQHTHKNDNQRNGNGNSNKFHKNNNGNSYSNSNSNNNRYGNSNNKQNSYNGRQNQGNKHGQNGNQSRTYTNSNYKRSNDAQQIRLMQGQGNELTPGNGGQTS